MNFLCSLLQFRIHVEIVIIMFFRMGSHMRMRQDQRRKEHVITGTSHVKIKERCSVDSRHRRSVRHHWPRHPLSPRLMIVYLRRIKSVISRPLLLGLRIQVLGDFAHREASQVVGKDERSVRTSAVYHEATERHIRVIYLREQ